MCQVIDYYSSGCGCTDRYRVVHRCFAGFDLEATSCKINNNQIIAYRPIFNPRYCDTCEIARLTAIAETYQVYAREITNQARSENWMPEMIFGALQRNSAATNKEIGAFLDAVAEREIRDQNRFGNQRGTERVRINEEDTRSEDSSDDERRVLADISDSKSADERSSSSLGNQWPGFPNRSNSIDDDESSAAETNRGLFPIFGRDRRMELEAEDDPSDGWCYNCECYHDDDDEATSTDESQDGFGRMDEGPCPEEGPLPNHHILKNQIIDICGRLGTTLLVRTAPDSENDLDIEIDEGDYADVEDNLED